MVDAAQQGTSAGLPHPDDLRGYVDYLRDLGIYDLLARESHPATDATLTPAIIRDAADNAMGSPADAGSAIAAWASEYLCQPVDAAGQKPSSPVQRTASPAQSTAASGRVGSMQGSAATRPPAPSASRPAGPAAPRPGTPASPPLSPFDQAQQRRAAANAPRPNSGPDIQITPPTAPAALLSRPAAAPPPQNISAAAAGIVTAEMPAPTPFNLLAPLPAQRVDPADKSAALDALRKHIGDCTRCPLAYAGRHSIVYADGDPNARLLFVGEGPGADEDEQGIPFVGKAGQLLNNMIAAMGLRREQVYIANIVKCRPPKNRVPEPVEANTCSQFLLQQIDIVAPEVIVALGSTAATYLLGKKQSLSSLRGQWFDVRGAKCAVTYHPAFLLRDPRQKGEAWKDLQRVMGELKLKPPAPRG